MTVLIHKTFEKHSIEFKANNPKLEGELVTAINEIAVNPQPGALQGLGKPLQGVVHKKHVGGPRGHRLLYLYFNKSDIVIPAFISPTPKSKFDYDQVNWEEVCRDLYEDYTKKKYSEFANWKR